MLAGEDIAGAPHNGSQLVNLIPTAIENRPAKRPVAEVSDHKIVGLGTSILVVFEVYAADPKSLLLKSLNEMPTDKSSSPTHDSYARHSTCSRSNEDSLPDSSGCSLSL